MRKKDRLIPSNERKIIEFESNLKIIPRKQRVVQTSGLQEISYRGLDKLSGAGQFNFLHFRRRMRLYIQQRYDHSGRRRLFEFVILL